ncbi:39S ribosomal protein L53 like protein [Argiope bruennichi]|uniref:Large ribosomal subunit protein mL53 n=1 Tax=Argiope bruennichi TaxID=94029 RepID=A0A8T0ERL1_ARGBR|nr:39S ribosomal protein L53 like protein [Argiope bruennichi]
MEQNRNQQTNIYNRSTVKKSEEKNWRKTSTIRDFYFHISSKKIRKTNEGCIFKADVVNDRSEPIISIDLSNGLNVLFKCSNLSPLEVAKEFNQIVEKYDVPEDDGTSKLKGALLKKATKAKKRK